MDKNLNSLLKWSIEHTAPSAHQTTDIRAADETASPSAEQAAAPTTSGDPSAPSGGGATHRPIDPAVLDALFGGPSEADLMKAAIEVITSPASENVPLEQKLIAFDNLEQLIESLDNANNLEPLALWSPLLSVLEHEEAELRKMAAWCVGTAVQNNVKTQERLLAMGQLGLPKLVELAVKGDETEGVRRKAVYALSSAVRNYQPALDVVLEELARLGVEGHEGGKKQEVEATDMNAVDEVIGRLKKAIQGAK
ncbi:nucleotide exchange factor Fes1-domain-containing protein [Rhypophila decipiens]|uniref:Nucleotide exchange factor Fes1-domain-containing protein n=1 Tax=Rhypophila decipiens TaxID=261697 RepID=A0AAN6YMN7_9PEZI|nr:nucleotide exchange factor Fes1-domain-containing protein [Rhypophila decipiens]